VKYSKTIKGKGPPGAKAPCDPSTRGTDKKKVNGYQEDQERNTLKAHAWVFGNERAGSANASMIDRALTSAREKRERKLRRQ